MTDGTFDLASQPAHLGLGATAIPQEPFDGMAWYERYGSRTAGDGAEGRLVTLSEFSEPWDSWEVHPHGDELVVCLDGELTVHQEIDGGVRTVVLGPNQAIVNPPGTWHTADVDRPTRVLFITAGLGTDHRPR
jgi:mannose-6-phosphate isomerase-like protein (cupin superfamily)